jgi:5'-3' exonuclease
VNSEAHTAAVSDAPVVHLVDAHVYVFRAWFSLPPMLAPDGTPCGAAYGFANTLIRYLGERAPSHLACCFDFALTSFRNELYPGYKASRGDEVPAELEPQFALCQEAARALGVPIFEAERYEADDVIATLTEQTCAVGARVVIVSSDKDLCQLVREDGGAVHHDLQRERTLDAKGVRERFGVAPEQIPDWLALVGDAVDDLPGVPGFGPKSAAAALEAFGRLDAFPADPARWSALGVRGGERLAARFAEHRERALGVRSLATLVRDVPALAVGVEQLAWRGADAAAFDALCARLGWGRIATRVPRWRPSV